MAQARRIFSGKRISKTGQLPTIRFYDATWRPEAGRPGAATHSLEFRHTMTQCLTRGRAPEFQKSRAKILPGRTAAEPDGIPEPVNNCLTRKTRKLSKIAAGPRRLVPDGTLKRELHTEIQAENA
jgi:hypothetical protein